MKLEQAVIDIVREDVAKFVKEKIAKTISQIDGIPQEKVKYNPNESLHVLGFDDLDAADLAIDAEDKFKILIDEDDKTLYGMSENTLIVYLTKKVIAREEEKPEYV